MNPESPENEWERSKENVQPLRQGRNMSSLNAGLKAHTGEQIARIKEEKHVFEAELRTYAGDDPIEVWYRYILWAEQTFPTGGRDSNLTTILERCVRQFKDDERYRNDERYIYSWMKLADVSNSPLEMYNFMYDQNIGCDLSCFYECWAGHLEQLGNYKRADMVYKNGLEKNAKPYETLQQRHDDFQKRVARRIANGTDGMADGSADQEPDGRHRQALSQLRTLGKNKQAPINRTGTAIRGSAGVLAGARPKITPQLSNAGIQIFSDENQSPSYSLPPQTGQWRTAPNEETYSKENEMKPGVWTKQKLSKPSVSVPISDVKQPSFSVHVDDMRTPAKKPAIDNKALSCRKEDKNPTSDYLKTMTDTQSHIERPMYCKEKIYCGAEEYSFEELRAVRWLKKEEQKRLEEEENAMQERRERLEREKQQLLNDSERIRQQRLKLQQEEMRMLEDAKRKQQQHHLEMERNRQIEIQRHQEILEENINSRLQEQVARSQNGLTAPSASKHQQSSRQLMFDDSGHGNTENISPSVHAQLQAANNQRHGNTENISPSVHAQLQAANNQRHGNTENISPSVHPQLQSANNQRHGNTENISPSVHAQLQAANNQRHGNTENISPSVHAQLQAANNQRPLQQKGLINPAAGNHSLNSNSFSNMSNPQSGESFDRTLSGAPSPTVNTKEAMRLVMSMFNASLELDKPAASEDVDMHEPTPVRQQQPAGLPFTIYDESQGQQKVQPKPSLVAPSKPSMPQPFTVFQDDKAVVPPKPNLQQPFAVFQDNVTPPKPKKQQPFTVFQDDKVAAPPKPNMQQPFTVFQDDKVAAPPKPNIQDSGKSFPSSSSKSGSSRSSLFQQSHNMTSARPLFDDHIESHPRDDLTLAPVGSHLSFTAAAKFSSTPFNPNSSGGARSCAALDDSDIEMPEPVVPARPVMSFTNTEEMEHQENDNQSAATNTSGNSFHKNLSPIMEGSSEDSSANSKSNKLQHTTMESLSSFIPKAHLTPVLDQSEDTRSLLQAIDDGNQSAHVIDTSAYIPPEMDEKTEQLMSMSICIVDPKDPFDSKQREKMLSGLKKSLHHLDKYTEKDDIMPVVRKGSILALDCEVYEVIEKIGEGGFAKVFLVEDYETGMCTEMLESGARSTMAIKVEEPPQKWEFYICNELHDRLSKLKDPVDIRPAIMQIQHGYFFKNSSILVTEYQPHGTLLDLVNKCKTKNVQSDNVLQHLEPVMAYMTIELIHIIENIHKCHIIHGDVKPDNFLMLQFPRLPVSMDPAVVFGGTTRFVQLIDFGQGIDMTKYPAGTTFLTKVTTQSFQCIEMKTNRPWTYQTDLFGLAGTIHVLIFNQYMNIYQEGGHWKMTSKFARNWNGSLWKKLFDILLNVPSCDELPDLSKIRKEFESYFLAHLLEKYNTQCGSFNKTIVSK